MNLKCPYVKLRRNSDHVFTGDVILPHSMWAGYLGKTYHDVIAVVLQNLNYKNPTNTPVNKVEISCDDDSLNEGQIDRIGKILQKKSGVEFYQP